MKTMLITTLVLLLGLFSFSVYDLATPKEYTVTYHKLPTNQLQLYQQRLSTFSQILGPGEFQPKPYNHRIEP